MKTIVSVQEVSELELKPPAELTRWRTLVDDEIKSRWSSRTSWAAANWPTCGLDSARPAFERHGLTYVESSSCHSLFASPRPGEAELTAWYRDSAPSRYWREVFLPACRDIRFDKIARPRADWVLDGLAEYSPKAKTLIDVSANGRDMLALIAEEAPYLQAIIAAGLAADLEGPSTARISVKPSATAEIKQLGPADAIVAFDALDRAHDFGALIEAFHETLSKGGVLFASLPVASGFEIQSLWEKSPSIIPPDKLNLPSVAALMQIFASPKWELIELSTPGIFDVELVRRAIAAEPSAPWPRVLRALIERQTSATRMALVELLQASRLASLARIVARKV